MSDRPNELSTNPISPEFLGTIDQYLLQNYPRLWSSRLHHLVFYGFLATLTVVLCRISNIQILVIILGLILFFGTIAAFLYWGNSVWKYSVEREFGHTHPILAIVEVGIYGMCVAVILTPFLVLAFFETPFFWMAYILAFNSGVIVFSMKHFPVSSDKAWGATFSPIFLYFAFTLFLPWFVAPKIFQFIGEVLLLFAIPSWIGSFWIVWKVIHIRRQGTYLKWNVLTIFPFSIAISIYIFLLLVTEENLNIEILARSAPYAVLATLSYVPFLPCLKKQYMNIIAWD